MFYLVLGLVLLPVKQAMEIPESVVSDLFVELTPYFSFASDVDAPVVHRDLAGLRVAWGLVADVVAFVVHFEQMAQKQLDLVPDEFVRNHFFAFFALHAADAVLVGCLEHSWEFELDTAIRVGAAHGESSDWTVLQLLLGFRLKDSIVQVGVVFVLVIICFARRVLVLCGIYAQALGNKVDVDAVDVLDQTGDRWHNLLRNVVLSIDFQFSFLF